MTSRLAPSNLRAAWWALRSLHQARRHLAKQRVDRLRLRPPPPLPDGAVRAVIGTLRRRPHSCLERALVLRCWHAAHGRPQDVVIGVKGTREDFAAHAWLEGHDACHGDSFVEMLHLPARGGE